MKYPSVNNDDLFRISIVDLSGETNVAYTPLAALYLKSAILDYPELASRSEVKVHHFLQRHTPAEMLDELVEYMPHVIGFSCQGWNFRQLISLFSPLKQFLPDTIIVLGGNHVTNRAERLLPAYPEVDVLVNGEGEFTFRELLYALVQGDSLESIPGLSFYVGRDIVTTPARELTRDMELIPSAYSLNDLDLTQFDVALLETNRGCPYMCGFCYWGGRIGQKIAIGELQRVRSDLERIAKAGIETIFLCDANFGILEQDLEVAKTVVEMYQTYGYPREFNVNWAKNHASRVGEVINILQDGGINTTINVPLQTLSPSALALAGRYETGRKEMIDLAMQMVRDGTELYCELIFGLPGETFEEFKQNYDRLFLMFPILRIHPLWVLPNTAYDRDREKHGIRTISPDPTSDYEAVLTHNTITRAEMNDGLSMLLAHSTLNLLGTARDALRLLALYDGRSVAECLCAFEPFLASRTDYLGTELYSLFQRIRQASYFERSLRDRERQLLYSDKAMTLELIRTFLLEQGVPDDVHDPCMELIRYNNVLLPRSDLQAEGFSEASYSFSLNPIELSALLARGDSAWQNWIANDAQPIELVVRHKSGLAKLNGVNCDLTGAWNGRVLQDLVRSI